MIQKFHFILFTCLLGFCVQSNAQIEKILHQDFNIDGMTAVDFDLVGDYYIEKWAGTTILVETKVTLESATPAILRYTLDSGRYEIILLEDGQTATLQTKVGKRLMLRNKSKDVTESISVKIMVPEDFNTEDIKHITRKEDSNASTIKSED